MKAKIFIAVLAFAPALAVAQAELGAREIMIAGSGASDSDFDANALGLTLEYGYYWRNNIEVGARQSLNIADSAAGDSWLGSTRAYADYYFGSPSNFQPYAGANFGLTYGDDINDTLFAGPEIGAKYYVKPQTFVDVRAEYQIFFEDASEVDDGFDDGSWVYSVGAGWNF